MIFNPISSHFSFIPEFDKRKMNFLRDFLIFLLICLEKYGKLWKYIMLYVRFICCDRIRSRPRERIIELRFPLDGRICITAAASGILCKALRVETGQNDLCDSVFHSFSQQQINSNDFAAAGFHFIRFV